MKTFLISITLLTGTFLSCSRNTSSAQIPKKNTNNKDLISLGKYSHAIKGCMNPDPNVSCSEWIKFINDSSANILAGGDMMMIGKYKRRESLVQVSFTFSDVKYLFKILDKDTLQNMKDQSKWIKSN